MKVAMTLDGRIAPAIGVRINAKPFWITGEAAREAVHRMRGASDAILTGVDTVIADDPLLTDRSGLKRRGPLLRVVLDSALRIPLDSKLVSTANSDVVVFTACQESDRTEKLIARGVRVEIVDAVAGRISLHAVLEKLGAEDILTVLTETGTRLNTALLVSGLVDRLTIFMSPKLMGSDAVPAFRSLSLPVSLDAAEVERFGNDLCVSSLLRDPWSAHHA
jgi:diaminohydroxyphosphoribosylaminopyrimidine deaminase/5-amino-6-(5-phosphoribosylamino)uracil reductase